MQPPYTRSCDLLLGTGEPFGHDVINSMLLSLLDCVEKWCHDYFLNWASLRMADVIRAELLEIIKRIELPYAEPAFGSRENTLNIKKALLSGYFMQVRMDGAAFPVVLTRPHMQDMLSGTTSQDNPCTGVHFEAKQNFCYSRLGM